MSKPEMEPAFPAKTVTNDEFGGTVWHHPGMTLRDYFAAAALQGLAAKYGGADYSTFAIYAYGFADAMLAKREAE